MSYLTKTPYGLLPCPHCGGEAEARDGSSTRPYIRCKSCGCRTGSSYDTDKLKEAWNRRVERACRPSVDDDGAGAWGVYCSECGYRFAGPYGNRDVPEHMAKRRDIMLRYCPFCGARIEVVE